MTLLRRLFLAAAALAVVASTDTASARAVTSEQYRALVERALGDPSAAAELRGITSVDGQPVDMERALARADATELVDRLRTLADNPQTQATTEDASALARSILARPEFRTQGDEGVVAGLRQFFAPLRRWLAQVIAHIVDGPLIVILALLIVLGSALFAARIASGSTRAGPRSGRRTQQASLENAASLERAADEAEARGDLERALRLRFRGALLRLGELGVIEFTPSLTSGQVARRLRSPTFDEARTAFDEVVYGRRAVTSSDLEAVRRVPVDVPREAAA